MVVIETKEQLVSKRRELQGSIGFVPTMGNLHKGHLSLVMQSLTENDETIVSIFVNPLQFGENEDFSKYPRTLEEDIKKLKGLSEKILLFIPSFNDVYPKNHNSLIHIKDISGLCADIRPGHFDGVATVIYYLFSMTRPHRAYFGQKDLQQFFVINKLVSDFQFPIKLKMMPIAREESGLALSSRNSYLKDQLEAIELIETLRKLKSDFFKNRELMEQNIQKIKKQDHWNYLEMVDVETLKKPTNLSKRIAICGSITVQNVKLIDNIIINMEN